MSSTSKRGKDGTLFVSDETGKRYTFLVKNFTDSPQTSIEMREYIGKSTPSGDPDYNGTNLTWDCDEDDTMVVDLRQFLLKRMYDRQAPYRFTIAFREKARKAGVKSATTSWPGCVMVPKDKSAGGMKDTIGSSWEAYCDAAPDLIKQS
jgi:hypothetical protein